MRFRDAAPFRQSRTEGESNRRGVEQKQVHEQEAANRRGMEQEPIRDRKGFATLRHLGRVEQEGSGTEADKGTRGFATLRHLSRVEKKESRTDCGFDYSSVKMTSKYPQTMFLTTVT